MSSDEAREPHDQLNFRIPERLHREFHEIAVKRKTTESRILRDYVKNYVAEARKTVVY